MGDERAQRVVGVIRRRWFQIFISGSVLLYLVERARATDAAIPSLQELHQEVVG